MTKLIFLAAILVISLVSPQKDLWLMPDKFVYAAGDTCRIMLHTGENFTGSVAELQKGEIASMEWINKGKKRSLSGFNEQGKPELIFRLAQEGTHKIVLKTTEQQVRYDAEAFNQYLKDHDLGEVMYARESNGDNAKPAEVLQSSSHTVLIQSGATVDEAISTSGLPIEIRPDKNPYALKMGDPIKFTVLYNKKPLFGARVKIWNRYNNRTTLQHIYTEKDGTITTHLSSPGPWMISVVKMDAHDQGMIQWKGYSANLVYGVQ